MFISKKHLAMIEETLYLLRHRCAYLEKELGQMKCEHQSVEFEPVPHISAFGGTIKYAPGVKYQEVCTKCQKVLGYRTMEEKARREYEAAKAAYNAVKESE